MRQPVFGKWWIGDPEETGFLAPIEIEGWKFTDYAGIVGIFDSKESALAAHKSKEAWEKHCGY